MEIAEKKIGEIKLVVSGAGASAQSCLKLYISLGIKKENIYVFDSKGLIHKDRLDLDENKKFFIQKSSKCTLEEAMVNADVFLGLSRGGILNKKMIKSMAKEPIVFALANPEPEIPYEIAMSTRMI